MATIRPATQEELDEWKEIKTPNVLAWKDVERYLPFVCQLEKQTLECFLTEMISIDEEEKEYLRRKYKGLTTLEIWSAMDHVQQALWMTGIGHDLDNISTKLLHFHVTVFGHEDVFWNYTVPLCNALQPVKYAVLFFMWLMRYPCNMKTVESWRLLTRVEKERLLSLHCVENGIDLIQNWTPDWKKEKKLATGLKRVPVPADASLTTSQRDFVVALDDVTGLRQRMGDRLFFMKEVRAVSEMN